MDNSDAAIAKTLLGAFKHDSFKSKEQETACKALINGHDVFAALPTGAGKSLIFQLAAVHQQGVAIVVEPLLSLIQNQVLNASALGLVARTVTADTPKAERVTIVEAIEAGCEPVLFYVTPEMATQPWFKDYIARLQQVKRLKLICVDEAHVISSWADDFRPSYGRLGSLRAMAPSVPFLALSATAPAVVISDVSSRLQLKPDAVITRLMPRHLNLYLDVVKATALANVDANTAAFINRVLDIDASGSVIVYCRAKTACEEMVRRLREFGVACLLYHGDRRKEERDRVQELWLSDTVRVLVGTVAFGLGINKSNVRAVIHMNVPSSISAYAQETGRAGRDGRRAYCRLYLRENESRSISAIVAEERKKLMTVPQERRLPQRRIDERVESVRRKFDASLAFFNDDKKCRHSVVARHLDFDNCADCVYHCDNCQKK